MNDLETLLTLIHALKASTQESVFEVGKSYFIRSATYHNVGRVKQVTRDFLILENASWIADSGRFHDVLKNGEFKEVEPYVEDLIIFLGGGIDATEWKHPLPTIQK